MHKTSLMFPITYYKQQGFRIHSVGNKIDHMQKYDFEYIDKVIVETGKT